MCPTAGKTGTATAGEDETSRVSSSWFTGFTPKLATAVMYNRGKGNEQLEGYLNPFFGGTYPAMTFRAFMNRALDASDCGSFPPPANIKSTKGTNFKKPPPTCGGNTQLNGAKTRCVDKPKPKPTPQPTPTPAPTCVPPQVGNPPNCKDPKPVDLCPDTPNPNDVPPCDEPKL